MCTFTELDVHELVRIWQRTASLQRYGHQLRRNVMSTMYQMKAGQRLLPTIRKHTTTSPSIYWQKKIEALVYVYTLTNVHHGHAYAHTYLTCMFVHGGAFLWIAPNHGKAILNTVPADLKIFSDVDQRMLTLYWFWRLWRPKQWKLLRFGDMKVTVWISSTCVAWGSPKCPKRYV